MSAVTSGPILDVQGVSRYFAGLRANDDVSLSVAAGEIVGLIGPNGAGKSTLFNLIAGALTPTAGRIVFEGRDITALAPPQRCEIGIARTFQVVRSFDSMSVIDNVMVGAMLRERSPRVARRNACEVLEFTDLAERATTLARDLTSPEKRRLELARALATRPKLFLLDEVMAGLTPTEAKRGVELIKRIRAAGTTVIMVEHVMEVVMPLVDRAIVLDLGRVISSGSPAEVVADPKVITAYLGERRRA
jgi:branched-chain amino acid transport system ATP-binding protein